SRDLRLGGPSRTDRIHQAAHREFRLHGDRSRRSLDGWPSAAGRGSARRSRPRRIRRSLTKPVTERGYEGYVAKDEASVYEGSATRRWLQVKARGWTVAEDRWRRRAPANLASGACV